MTQPATPLAPITRRQSVLTIGPLLEASSLTLGIDGTERRVMLDVEKVQELLNREFDTNATLNEGKMVTAIAGLIERTRVGQRVEEDFWNTRAVTVVYAKTLFPHRGTLRLRMHRVIRCVIELRGMTASFREY